MLVCEINPNALGFARCPNDKAKMVHVPGKLKNGEWCRCDLKVRPKLNPATGRLEVPSASGKLGPKCTNIPIKS